ncbi:MAG TPA: RNA polymerase sigma-70 factor [Ktedonobacterales bacterium]|nr:RNA polymerase sigma-70 factor [Ktedonobacterales bacterium]
MSDIEIFESLRPLLFSIAYRMLGSVMDAEDIVQEAYLQWQRRGDAEIASPRGFLSTIVTRQSINHLNSARVRRETYPGPWLPEPALNEVEPDSSDRLLLHESLSMAFMMLLEQMAPVERAVFLLHDVFVYDFAEIAHMVGRSEANCRQIGRRARQHIQAHRPRFDADQQQQQRLTQQFITACTTGDINQLVTALAEDVTFWGDGGGKAAFSAPRPIVGAQDVDAFIVGVLQKVPGTLRTTPVTVNGQPGFIFATEFALGGVLALDIVDQRICGIRFVANPDKLRAIPETGGGSGSVN